MFNFFKSKKLISASEARTILRQNNKYEDKCLNEISIMIKEAARNGLKSITVNNDIATNNEKIVQTIRKMGYKVEIKNDSPYKTYYDNYMIISW